MNLDSPAIHIQRLTKRFGRGSFARLALDGLDLTVPRGQVFGFLGKNGAGKTTTIRILLDLVRPSGGVVSILGCDPHRERSVLRRVGALVENPAFYPFLSGRGNLELLAELSGSHQNRPTIDILLARVGLMPSAEVKFSAYSTGMKQRLGIAAALLNDPELVILDEPTNGMDPVGIIEIRQLIHDLVHKDGKTVFLSSHLLSEVEQICDRIAIIDKGRLVREGTVADLLSSRSYAVKIEVGNVEAALMALKENPPNMLWNAYPLSGERAGENAIEVHIPRTEIPVVMSRLVTAGIAIYEVRQERPSLEALFLSLIDSLPTTESKSNNG